MIKNNSQLIQSQERLKKIQNELNEYRKDANNLTHKSLTISLEYEEEKIQNEILEYSRLKELSFEAAVTSVLNKHVLLDNIGELLAKLRIAAKLSQADLADRLDWEQANVSRFENESYSGQTVSKIVEYASALDIWLHVVPSLNDEIDTKINKKVELRSIWKKSIDDSMVIRGSVFNRDVVLHGTFEDAYSSFNEQISDLQQLQQLNVQISGPYSILTGTQGIISMSDTDDDDVLSTTHQMFLSKKLSNRGIEMKPSTISDDKKPQKV
jgi:transcriptional regulator with XRE-family HTH domain